MSRLYRPHIPLAVRVQVAERQMLAATGCVCTDGMGIPFNVAKGVSLQKRLDAALWHLAHCGQHKMHLDHDPPLAARQKVPVRRPAPDHRWFNSFGVALRYEPDANDPRFLVYRTDVEHRLKTNVRGEHGQHPDRVLIKKARRQEAAHSRTHKKTRKKAKRLWPSRPFPKARPGIASRRNP